MFIVQVCATYITALTLRAPEVGCQQLQLVLGSALAVHRHH